MKFIRTLLVVALLVVSSTAMAQQKFAVIDAASVFQSMPEQDSIQIKLQAVQQGLVADMQAMEQEYTTKVQDFQKNVESYTQTMREQKSSELESLYSRMEQFSAVAEKEMQEQQAILLTPVQTRLMDAIKKVGSDNNFVFIFDKSSALYVSDSQVVDATSLVKAELGIAQ